MYVRYVWTWKILNPQRNICGFKKYTDRGGRGLSTHAEYLIARPQSHSAEFERKKGAQGTIISIFTISGELQFSHVLSRKWPKLPECMQYYPSQTNWIWQFFRETNLPPLPGGCALTAIASAPASIIKCYFTSLTTLLNISALHVQYGIQAFAIWLNLSVQNALPGGACARNSLEKCALLRSPNGR